MPDEMNTTRTRKQNIPIEETDGQKNTAKGEVSYFQQVTWQDHHDISNIDHINVKKRNVSYMLLRAMLIFTWHTGCCLILRNNPSKTKGVVSEIEKKRHTMTSSEQNDWLLQVRFFTENIGLFNVILEHCSIQ